MYESQIAGILSPSIEQEQRIHSQYSQHSNTYTDNPAGNQCQFNYHSSSHNHPFRNESVYIDQFEEDRLGLTVTSGQVVIEKDESGLVGISIGGGAPHCPCLYIIQIFDNSAADKDGTLQPGDEITAVNGQSIKNCTRSQAAKAIQDSKDKVILNYNKLHIEEGKESKSLDILLKKLKHRLTENLSPSAADAFGLSRAILCNDSLAKKIKELERNERIYSALKLKVRKTFKAFLELNTIYKQFGDVFAEIGCKEIQPQVGEALIKFGELHRQVEKFANICLKNATIVISNLDTYISRAIPDTKATIRKYQDIKFEYLSYCLKVKELEDEEKDYYSIQEPLFRVETGNYEYRVVLKSRQKARLKFTKLRTDVLAKIELLDQKHVNHLSSQLLTILSSLQEYNSLCLNTFKQQQKVCGKTFPIDMDLSKCFDFNYEDEQDYTEEANLNEDDDI